MKNFQIIRALSSKSAVTTIAKENSAMFIAGGTNLVDLMKKNVVAPDKLIDINGVDLKNRIPDRKSFNWRNGQKQSGCRR